MTIPSNVSIERWKCTDFDNYVEVETLPAAHLSMSDGRVDLSGPGFRSIVSGGKIEEVTTSYGGSGHDLHLKVLVPNTFRSKWHPEKWYIAFLR